MATLKLTETDPPPPPLQIASPFTLTEVQRRMLTKISDNLEVNPLWVEQGLYFSLKSNPQCVGDELSAEASAWVLENHPRVRYLYQFTDEDDDLEDMMDTAGDAAGNGSQFKMVFVTNSELQMSSGKMAAQVAHGAVDLYIKLSQDPRSVVYVQEWMSEGSTKIVLRGKDTRQLYDLKDRAQADGLSLNITYDAGKTEVQAGALTCLAIFGQVRDVDKVTESLPLLQ